jgi:flagellar hook-basal body complex protein FliE
MDDLFQAIGGDDRSLSIRDKELRFLSMEESKAAGASEFSALLDGALGAVGESSDAVKTSLAGLVSGEPMEVHDVLVAMGKSEVAFTMMLEVRNKLLDAWREITRIPI